MHMHVKDVRVIPKEVVMKRCDINSVVQERRHNRINFLLKEHQVAHHYVGAVGRLGEGNPPAEPEGRRSRESLYGHLQVVAWDIHLQNASFEITFSVQRLEDFLIVIRHLLGDGRRARNDEASTSQPKQPSRLYRAKHRHNLLFFWAENQKTYGFNLIADE